MTVQQATQEFSSHPKEEQIDLLLRLGHALTILARDSYEVGQDGLTRPSRVRTINEVQHRILGFLLSLTKNDPHRYPDSVLMQIILEHPEDPELQRQIQTEFVRLIAQTTAAA